ncbi:hypothetical protein BLOT_003477 [Blomia tropicalis]|nr:hypothetical protein BLOT_003477 [Blomia tropicalis]
MKNCSKMVCLNIVSSSENPFSSEPMNNIIGDQHIDGDGAKPFNHATLHILADETIKPDYKSISCWW